MTETQTATQEKSKTNVVRMPRPAPICAAKDSDFGLREHRRAEFDHVMPVGRDFKECLRPEYWVNVCRHLKKDPRVGKSDLTGAIIGVGTQDHQWYAELYVIAVQERGLEVSVLREPKELQPSKRANGGDKEFFMRWNVGSQGWDVIRTVDKAIVGSGKDLKTKEQAWEFIDKMKAG